MEDIRDNIKSGYRPDIDGLRAISILIVVAYHFDPRSFPGGYLGVDVFFVISGYLITRLIKGSLEKENFSFGHFYGRRIARLYPSLLLVFLTMLVLGGINMTAQEFKDLGAAILAGVSFSSNFLLFFEAGYFDKLAYFKPFLNLWSLGIEEQFYLIYPLFLFILYKKKWNFKKGLLAAGMISLVAAVISSFYSRDFTFYIPLTRFWELIVGGLLAISPKAADSKLIKGKGGIGLLLIVICTALAHSKYSGFILFNVIAVISAVLIISGPLDSFTSKMLKKRFLVYIGLISYPLYLWHWPLLSYLYIVESGKPTSFSKGIIFALALFLTILTYEFLEKPIHHFFNRSLAALKRSALALLCGSILIGVVSANIYLTAGWPGRPIVTAYAHNANQFGWHYGKYECEKKYVSSNSVCTLSDKERNPEIALIGDSHAEHFYPGLKEYFKRQNKTLILFHISGCLPFSAKTHSAGGEYEDCEKEVNKVIKWIKENLEIKEVIFAGQYTNHSRGPLGALISKKLQNTIEELKEKKITIIYQVPLLSIQPQACQDLRPFVISPPKKCRVSRKKTNDQQKVYREAFASIDLNSHPGPKFLDPTKVLCNDIDCDVLINGKILYRDPSHLSLFGSEYVVQKMFEQ